MQLIIIKGIKRDKNFFTTTFYYVFYNNYFNLERGWTALGGLTPTALIINKNK